MSVLIKEPPALARRLDKRDNPTYINNSPGEFTLSAFPALIRLTAAGRES
jgi:hypothetical protein